MRRKELIDETSSRRSDHDSVLRAGSCGGREDLDLAGTLEGNLLVSGLEDTVTELGRCVDELERRRGLLEGGTGGGWGERLSESDDTLLGTNDAALEQDEVVVDDTVVREATHWVDGLLGDVGVGRAGSLR